jgi:hypothetical protein
VASAELDVMIAETLEVILSVYVPLSESIPRSLIPRLHPSRKEALVQGKYRSRRKAGASSHVQE